MRPVTGNAHAAPHDKALHQRDIGFGIARDPGIETVFIGPEAAAEAIVARAPGVVKLLNVAAGAKRLVACRVDQDDGHVIVRAPVLQRRLYGRGHVVAQRIERLGAGEGDAPGAALFADVDIRAHWSASICRATIRRMISLVPSRISCTRRSRTSFSIP